MSYMLCSRCGHREEPFGHAGARHTAAAMDVEFLGELPLHSVVRARGDEGRPPTIDLQHEPAVQPYYAIAKRLLEKLAATTDNTPKISLE